MLILSLFPKVSQKVIININAHSIIVINNLRNDSGKNIDGIIPMHKTDNDKIKHGIDTVCRYLFIDKLHCFFAK